MTYPYEQTKSCGRRIDRHRLLMERLVGRKLGRFEYVHHKNGNKRDNRIENLELVTPAIHAIKHGQWKYARTKICLVCGKEFTPEATKRRRAKTCGRECGYRLLSQLFRRPNAPRSMYRDGAMPSEVAARGCRPSRRSSSGRRSKR